VAGTELVGETGNADAVAAFQPVGGGHRNVQVPVGTPGTTTAPLASEYPCGSPVVMINDQAESEPVSLAPW